MRVFKIGVIILVSLVIITELIGRYYGLTTYPLYDASNEFEYLLKPNQEVKIYRNRFTTNEFSMRSNTVNASDSIVVLLLGDSVVNGGNSVDQDSLASSILEEKLLVSYGKKVRVLNISDKTWSPDNLMAYLKKFGTFHADLMILVANSGDAYDPMTFQPIVGVAPTHPAENHIFALQTLLDKVWPVLEGKLIRKPEAANMPENKTKEAKQLVKGFSDLDSLHRHRQIPFFVYLHCTQPEVATNQLDPGGIAITNFCREKQIPMTVNQFKPDYFLDEIHLNNRGQRALADDLFPIIRDGLKL